MAEANDIKQLQDDVQNIKDELADVLASIKETLKAAQETSGEKSFDLPHFFQNLQEKFSFTKEESEKMLNDLKEMVAENPIKSLAIAAVAGYLFAKLTSLKGR